MKIKNDVFLNFIKSLLKSKYKKNKILMSNKPLETSSTQKSL